MFFGDKNNPFIKFQIIKQFYHFSYKIRIQSTGYHMGIFIYLFHIISFCQLSSAGYFTFISSISFANFDVTTFSMAPLSIRTDQNFTINCVVGLSNGNLILLNTKDQNPTFIYLYPFTSSVIHLQWNSNGIFSASKNEVKVYNPYKLKETLSMTFSQSIYKIATNKRNSTIVIAIAFPGRIDIYQNNTMVMTRALSNIPSMGIDCTGKYLYYFDGLRYVIDIVKRSVFNNNTISGSYLQVVGSCLMDLQDITVALLESGGAITIWDDYKQLGVYFGNPQTAIAFSKQDRYLISYEPRNKMLNLWLTNWTSFTSWHINETIKLSDLLTIQKIEIKNSMMLLYTNKKLEIYQVTADIPHQATLLEFILFCGIVVFCCCVKIVQVLRKRVNRYNSINQPIENRSPLLTQANFQTEGLKYGQKPKGNQQEVSQTKGNKINESINQEINTNNEKQYAKTSEKVNPYGF